MSFPIIEKLSDVEPVIDAIPEIKLFQRDGYQVVNYVFQKNDTFYNSCPYIRAMSRECRGLIFDSAGKLISRRYHKFFNVGENKETQNLQVYQWPALDKLDGTMIGPFMIGKELIWGTKMGCTEISHYIDMFVNRNPLYDYFVRPLLLLGMTPIFEYISKNNRIVLDYPQENMILTAIRNNRDGSYIPYENMANHAEISGIPCVSMLGYAHELVDNIPHREDIEGVVLRHSSGAMVKMKTEWYVKRHRCLDSVDNEKSLLIFVLQDQLDDILPLLTPSRKSIVQKYAEHTLIHLTYYIDKMIKDHIDIRSRMTRKEFALSNYDLCNISKPLHFALWNHNTDKIDHEFVKKILLSLVMNNGLISGQRYDNLIPIWGSKTLADFEV